ncbi:MAG: ATP-binding protein [Pseudomonadota bacterium]
MRAKFLLLGALVQGAVLCLLIWNSQRLMDDAVSKNADRVAHEYAVTLNLSLSPYASTGRLAEMRSYLGEMLSDPRDSFVRYILINDAKGHALLAVGTLPRMLAPLNEERAGLKTVLDGRMLHARTPLLLQQNQAGTLSFGISTDDLALARDEVLLQGSLIALAGFGAGLLLFYVFTTGIGRRLRELTGQSEKLARGDFGHQLPEHGGDELEVFSRSLNSMGSALRQRIGELDRAEQALRESEARFQTLFDTAPVALVVTDRAGHLLAVNQALSRVFGHTEADVLGKRSDEISFWADPGERARIWGKFERDGALYGETAKVKLRGGVAGDVAIWSSALSLDGGQTLVWALLDQSEELRAKRELKDLNISLESRVRERSAELEHALATLKRTQHDLISSEKMASLGSLVAGIAHELNTPIGNSLLAATTLTDRVEEFRSQVTAGTLKRTTLNEHLADVTLACGLISTSLQRAATLIASFKQVAVDQTNDERRVFQLRAIVDDTLATFSPRLRQANCATRVDMSEDLAMRSYPGSLCQVINNLITNALLHAFDQRTAPHIAIAARQKDEDNIEILFADDGVGMPEEVLRHVFDPFFTTKMGRGGTGLGMNIVYNIVTGVLGGRIDIETAPGRGTTVIMVLPRTAPQRASP